MIDFTLSIYLLKVLRSPLFELALRLAEEWMLEPLT